MSQEFASCLYFGHVMHRRVRPFAHRFVYRVFSILIDLDELPRLDRRLRLFSHNRWNVLSFFDKDHGARDGGALRPWIDSQLAAAGIDLQRGRIRILCFPRVLGYVFNPLTIWFCHHRDGRLAAILYEVSNTFGEHHVYLFHANDESEPVRQSCRKGFYVSPFLEITGGYDFRLRVPDERLSVFIRHFGTEGTRLVAAQTGRRTPLDDAKLMLGFLGYPLMTLKVIGAIHLQALHLLRKGARINRRPDPPPLVTRVGETQRES